MAQLSSMRQRIRAIETIRKITHAMQLISMSTHSRLRQKKEQLEAYKNAFKRITGLIKQSINKIETITQPTTTGSEKLCILVGSQKGLSGTFNISIFKFFEIETAVLEGNFALITIGKHATDYARLKKIKPIRHYDAFSPLNFVTIAQDITQYILHTRQQYQTVTVYSNYPRTFFIQKPQEIQLLPFQEQPLTSQTQNMPQPPEDYLWEDSPEQLYATVQELAIAITLQNLLFESLLAEQAARFLSMDAATRNAENLLNAMKLEYNKLRQAAITRELTELASSL